MTDPFHPIRLRDRYQNNELKRLSEKVNKALRKIIRPKGIHD